MSKLITGNPDQDSEFFRGLVENALDVVTVLGHDGRIVYNSPSIEEEFGFTPAELNGLGVTEFIHPEDLNSIARIITDIIEGAVEVEQAEFRFQHRDGSYRHVQAVARRMEMADEAVILVNSRDVTEQHNTLAELERSNELLSNIFSSSSNVLCLSHPQTGMMYDVNDAFLRIMGYERGEVIGKTTLELNLWGTSENRQRILDEIVATDGRLHNFRASVRTKSGDERIALIDTRYLTLGAETRILFSAQDITDILLVEESLRQAQKMEAVGRLTGGVAHDFNNLIGIVLGNAELLQVHLEGRRELEEFTRRIIGASNRAATLTSQLLAFSRRQTLLPEVIDLGTTLNALEPLLQTSVTETIEIRFQSETALWLCLVDQLQFENAVLNLILNAKDAMPQGGTVQIQLSNVVLNEQQHGRLLASAAAGDYVRMDIVDSGMGMTDEVRERAFEPFYTTKDVDKGTGMGLSMVFGFVKQSEGLIEIKSQPAMGTTVSVYFPRSTKLPEQITALDKSSSSLAGSGRALLIEDNLEFRNVVATYLRSVGYEVYESAGEQDIRSTVGEMVTVDLIVSDLLLQGAASGVDLVKQLHADFPNSPVIYMTGYAASEVVEDNCLCLEKPFTRQEFIDAVAATVAK